MYEILTIGMCQFKDVKHKVIYDLSLGFRFIFTRMGLFIQLLPGTGCIYTEKQNSSMADPKRTKVNPPGQKNVRKTISSKKCTHRWNLAKQTTKAKKLIIVTNKKYSNRDLKKKPLKNLKDCDNLMSSSKKLKKVSKLEVIDKCEVLSEISKVSDNTVESRNCYNGSQNKLKFDGFKHDETLNYFYKEEEDRVDEYSHEGKVNDSEELCLQGNESVTIVNNNNEKRNDIIRRMFVLDFFSSSSFKLSQANNSSSLTLADSVDTPSLMDIVSNKHEKIKELKHKLPVALKEYAHCKDEVEFETKQSTTPVMDRDNIELMSLLLKQKHFQIKKTNLFVYMETRSLWHPLVIDDIPWKWLNEQKWRLHTFSRYPHETTKSAILLAESGFAYIGTGEKNDDKVICFFCMVIKEHWRASDIIPVVHRDLSPECSLVTGKNCTNVPMTAPDGGLSLFCQLNNQDDIFTSQIGAKHSGQEIVELDSCGHQASAIGHHRPTLAIGDNESAYAHKHVQMAEQTVLGGNIHSSTHHGQSMQATSASYMPLSSNVHDSATTSNIGTVNSFISGGTSNVNQAVGYSESQSNRSTQVKQTSTGFTSAVATSRAGEAVGSNLQNPAIVSTSSTSSTNSSNVNQSTSIANSTTSSNVTQSTNSTTSSNVTQSTNIVSSTTSSSVTQNTNTINSTSSNITQSTNIINSTTSSDGNHSIIRPQENSVTTNPQNSTTRPTGRNPTYSELGIITERPKRFEYAVRAKRYESFQSWPNDHHIKKEDLADCGFYYAGYGDCARCFYCGGGLRNWEDNDNVYVEHARWFPKCAFIRQAMGQQFVDAVQYLNRDHDQISFEMVTQYIGSTAASLQLDTKYMPLKRDPAVIIILDMGYNEKDVFEAATYVKETYSILSADKLYEKLQLDGKQRTQRSIPTESQVISIRSSTDISRDESNMNELKEKNNQLRQQTVCKICMDKEVGVVFLPCGHLVSCTDCASALKDCPVCRNQVRGIVRAFMA